MPRTLHLTDAQATRLDALLAESRALTLDIHAVQNRADDDTSIVGEDAEMWWERADEKGHNLHQQIADLIVEVTPVNSPVQEHIDRICEHAGLGVMCGIFDVLLDREELPESVYFGISAQKVAALYDSRIAPAIDRVQRMIEPGGE